MISKEARKKMAEIKKEEKRQEREIIGNSICFDSRKVVCQLAWANYPYSVVNYDLVIATEVFL